MWKAFKEVSYSHCRYAKLHFHQNSQFSEGVSYSEGDYQKKNAPSSISFTVHKVWSFEEQFYCICTMFLNTVKTQTLAPKHIWLDHMHGNIVYKKHICSILIPENDTIFPTNLSAPSCLSISWHIIHKLNTPKKVHLPLSMKLFLTNSLRKNTVFVHYKSLLTDLWTILLQKLSFLCCSEP